ncbi:unnamed protein product [Cyprideis torosa]|uniref:Uncharacterized protein n=1 Tax=Cyprideis torosa TaxID=163714 RepID=A0A7R8W9K1_9CRUS|nr:unnamed protein product [Cyprideis torosa]CAG0884960.1 unnamed protein product [Cyprideis torosa]
MVSPGFGDTSLHEEPVVLATEASEPSLSNPPSSSRSVEDRKFDAEKQSVYRHPLFPLLALLFEKCEHATQSNEFCTTDQFNRELHAFIQLQKEKSKPFFSDEPEIDSLMVKAIQVLRIHLLELEKVQELCKDFCTRYIACLKGKLHSENLLKTDGYESADSDETGEFSISRQRGGDADFTPPPQSQPIPSYALVLGPAGGSFPPGTDLSALLKRGTPLSQIGTNIMHQDLIRGIDDDDESDSGNSGRKRSKRGVLPKPATAIMKAWLFQHITHPYPTEDEKRQLASQTGLTLLQVNNWFINARRRILQPMLDASDENIKQSLQNWSPDNSHENGDGSSYGSDSNDGRPENNGLSAVSDSVA